MHSTLYNWYLPASRWPPPGSSSPSFVVRKHFGPGGFEGRVWRPLSCLLCHNFLHLHLHEKKLCVINKNKNACLPTQLRVVILPKPSSSNCETKEDITTGVSTEVRSSWDPAAWPQRHSIDQGGLFYALPPRRGIQVPEVHSARLRVTHSTSIVLQNSSASGGTDVQRFQPCLMHTSEGTDMNGVRVSPRRRNHPSQTEDRSQQLKMLHKFRGRNIQRLQSEGSYCVISENNKRLLVSAPWNSCLR